MLALTSATGKLGSNTIAAILENKLIDSQNLVVCTSSDLNNAKLSHLLSKGITVRHADFDDASSLESAYTGCDKLFLVSTPRISMDYNDAPLWQGREKHHRAAIDAARKVGVQHVYYTSLAFGDPSKAGVMRAHLRTEKYLHELNDINWTIIREGIYNESWPLYFGYYFGLRNEKRKEVAVAGDGPISWTSIPDMSFATAKILAAPTEDWAGKTIYLSQKRTWTLQDIAGLVSKAKGEDIKLKFVSRDEYEKHYAQVLDMDIQGVEWWSSTYDALRDGECNINDDTLESILKDAGRKPTSLEDTVAEMMR